MGAQVVSGSVLSSADPLGAETALPAMPAAANHSQAERYSSRTSEEHEQLSRRLNLSKAQVLELFEQAGYSLTDLHRRLVALHGKEVPAINRIGGIGGFAVAVGIGDEFRDLVEREYGECAGHFKCTLANLGTHGPTLYTAYRTVTGLPISSLPTPIPFNPGLMVDALTRRLEQLPPDCGGPASLLRQLKQALTEKSPAERPREAVQKALINWLLPQGDATEQCSLMKLRDELGVAFPILKGKEVSYARMIWALGLTETIETFVSRWQRARCESATQLSQRLGFSQKGGSAMLTDMVGDWAALRAELSQEPRQVPASAGSMEFTPELMYAALKLTRESAVEELKGLNFDLGAFMAANPDRSAILAPFRAKGYTELFVKVLGLGPEIKEVLEKRIVGYGGSVKLLATSMGLGRTGDALDSLAHELGVEIRDPVIPAGNLLDTFGWTKDEVLKWLADGSWKTVGLLKGQLCRELSKRRPLSPVIITENMFDHPDIIWGCDIHKELSAQVRRIAADRSRSVNIIGKELGFHVGNSGNVLSRILLRCAPELLVELAQSDGAAPAPAPAAPRARVKSAAPTKARAAIKETPAPVTPRRMPGSPIPGIPKELAPDLIKLGPYLDLALELLKPENPIGDMGVLSRNLVDVFTEGIAVFDYIRGSAEAERLYAHQAVTAAEERLNEAVLAIYDRGIIEQLTPLARGMYYELGANLFERNRVEGQSRSEELAYLESALYARGTCPERNVEAEMKLEARILSIDPGHVGVLDIQKKRRDIADLAAKIGATSGFDERRAAAAELEALSPGHPMAARINDEQFVIRTIETLEHDLAVKSLQSYRSLDRSLGDCRMKLTAAPPDGFTDTGGVEGRNELLLRAAKIESGAAKMYVALRLKDLYDDLAAEAIPVTEAVTVQSDIGTALTRFFAMGKLTGPELQAQKTALDGATLRIREYTLMIPLSEEAVQIFGWQGEAPRRTDNVQKRFFERSVALAEVMKSRLRVDRNTLAKNGFGTVQRVVADVLQSLEEIRAKEQSQPGYSGYPKTNRFYTGVISLAERLAKKLNMDSPAPSASPAGGSRA